MVYDIFIPCSAHHMATQAAELLHCGQERPAGRETTHWQKVDVELQLHKKSWIQLKPHKSRGQNNKKRSRTHL